jgi:transposase
VRRVLREHQSLAPKKQGPSKLDDYRAVVRYKTLEQDWQTRQIFRYLRQLGFKGGETIVKEYVRQLRSKPARRPALRFETNPGVQGQVDLSPYRLDLGGVLTDVVCFSFVLAFSRWRFFYFVLHADHFTVMLGHRLAFEELDGVPGQVLYDQMKQVVVAVVDDEPILQDDFARLVAHYDFKVVVLEPGYKEGKGKVEKPFQDVETFLRHNTFHSLDDLNAKAYAWRRNELHLTPHRTTDEKPADRLLRERPFLQELPLEPFRCEERTRAHTGKHFHVERLGRFYSVPPQYADRWVTRCVLNGRLWVELDGEVISEHELKDDEERKFITLPEHEAAFREMGPRKKGTRKAFVAMGPAAQRFAEGLDRLHGGASTYQMTQILKLKSRIGQRRVLDALRYATGYEAFSHTAVSRIARVRRLGATAGAVEAAARSPRQHDDVRDASSEVSTESTGAPPPQLSGSTDNTVQRSLDDYETLLRNKAANNKSEDEDGQ